MADYPSGTYPSDFDDDDNSEAIDRRVTDLLTIDKEVFACHEAMGLIDIGANHIFFSKCVDNYSILPEELKELLEDMAKHVAKEELNKR
jgi:hypothetical protein